MSILSFIIGMLVGATLGIFLMAVLISNRNR